MNVEQIERQLICRLCSGTPEEQTQAYSLGISADLFLSWASVWEFVAWYRRTYHSFPPVSTVTQRFPSFEAIGASDPLGYYVDLLRDLVVRYSLDEAISSLGSYQSGAERVQVLSRVLTELKAGVLSTDATNWASSPEARLRLMEERRSKNGLLGYWSRWDTYNRLTLGVQNGHLMGLVGRPGSGKSWLCYVMGFDCWCQGAKLLVCSTEMSKDEIGRRFDFLWLNGVPYSLLRSGSFTKEQMLAIEESLRALHTHHELIILGKNEVRGVQSIGDKVRQFDAGFVIVDGAYLLRDDRESHSRVDRAYNICEDAKVLAESINVPMLFNWQINRKKGDGDDRISWGDALLQQTDVLVELTDGPGQGTRLLRLLKQREGPIGEFYVRFDLDRCDFRQFTVGD